jgi:glycosyltransferase involved in cell wall biosynthesis
MTAEPNHFKSRRQRILISGGLAVGGPQTHVTLLCRVLLQANSEVTIVSASTNWPEEAITDLKAMGVRVIVSRFGFGRLGILGKLWAFFSWPFLLRRDYDVLYCIGEGKMHLWASRFAGKNASQIYHEIVDCPSQGSARAKVAAKMDAIVANSQIVGRQISRLFPRIPVCVIPFLTSSAPMAAPLKRELDSKRTLRIAFLGRLVPHKRPDRLVEAWSSWNACAPIGPARLDFYGGDYDNEGGRLRARITELRLNDSICLHGVYSTGDLPAIFDRTDMVVLPSIYEGLPLVLVEAMLRGIPVVATSAGGTAELGEDNPDVIITKDADWDAFEAGVKLMAERIRNEKIDRVRLHAWTECRYGFKPVAEMWRKALSTPEAFFIGKTRSSRHALV